MERGTTPRRTVPKMWTQSATGSSPAEYSLGGGYLTGERVVRRLAAILAADVVGYSRLMGRDEQGGLRTTKSERLTSICGLPSAPAQRSNNLRLQKIQAQSIGHLAGVELRRSFAGRAFKFGGRAAANVTNVTPKER